MKKPSIEKDQKETEIEETENYYINLANDHYGLEIRDNTRDEKIEIGKSIERGE